MFYLFRTEKNPKGPSLKRIQSLCFELIDSSLHISLPYGNSTFIERDDEVNQSINIYDVDTYTENKENSLYSYRTILNRTYEYSRFNHRGFGNSLVRLNICRCSHVNNLLDKEKLKEIISSKENESIASFNKRVDDDSKLYITRDFEFISIGHETVLCYGQSREYDEVPHLHYCAAISPHHYFSLSFKHLSVRDTESAWYKMAKSLEQKILSSVKLELNDSMQLLKSGNT